MDNKRIIDPESRDYSFSEIKPDERFLQINKEVIATLILFVLHSAFIIVNVVVGTSGDPLASLTFGLPTWLVIQLVEFLVYIVLVFIMVSKVYRDMDVAPRGKIFQK